MLRSCVDVALDHFVPQSTLYRSRPQKTKPKPLGVPETRFETSFDLESTVSQK